MPDRSTNENKAVEAYLQYLATGVIPVDPKEAMDLETLDQRIANESLLHRKIVLIQQRHRMTDPTPADAQPLVDKFVQYAKTFGERNHITYAVWREMGVEPRVLKQAGIPMTGMTHRANGTVPVGTRMALDDPRRIRAYAPRRVWTDEEKAEFVAIVDSHATIEAGAVAAIEHFNLTSTVHANKQRYHHYRRSLGLPPKSNKGRPRAKA